MGVVVVSSFRHGERGRAEYQLQLLLYPELSYKTVQLFGARAVTVVPLMLHSFHNYRGETLR